MEAVTTLLARARGAGLKIELDGQNLKVTGPTRASAIVQEIAHRKPQVIAHLQVEGCGSLHIQPQHWLHRGGKASCPACQRFMGYVRGER